MYVYLKTSNASSTSALTSGNGYSTGFELNRGAISSLGSLKPGETVTITVDYEAGKACDFTCDVRTINQNNWDAAYAKLADEMLNVTEYSDTYIKGDVTMNQDGVVMTSIPYTKGWSVKVDGQKVDVTPVGDALVSFNVSAGTHTVELSYIPDGFIMGLVLTLLGVALLILLYFVNKNFDAIVKVFTPAGTPAINLETNSENEDTTDSENKQEFDLKSVSADTSNQTDGFVYKEDTSEKTAGDADEVEDFKNVNSKERVEMSEEDIAAIMDQAFPKK